MLQKIAEYGEGAFAPEEVRILVAAFDAAWPSVLSSGAPFAQPAYHERARDTLAMSIILDAKCGESDERKLTDGALLRLSKIKLRN